MRRRGRNGSWSSGFAFLNALNERSRGALKAVLEG
jgi:hypothetical protein